MFSGFKSVWIIWHLEWRKANPSSIYGNEDKGRTLHLSLIVWLPPLEFRGNCSTWWDPANWSLTTHKRSKHLIGEFNIWTMNTISIGTIKDKVVVQCHHRRVHIQRFSLFHCTFETPHFIFGSFAILLGFFLNLVVGSWIVCLTYF